MPLPNNLVAYRDVQAIMSRALQAERGVKIKCANHGAAIGLRQRMYKFRMMERKDSTQIYAQDDPHYGKSDYDVLSVTLKEEGYWYVVLEKFPDHAQIEALIEEI